MGNIRYVSMMRIRPTGRTAVLGLVLTTFTFNSTGAAVMLSVPGSQPPALRGLPVPAAAMFPKSFPPRTLPEPAPKAPGYFSSYGSDLEAVSGFLARGGARSFRAASGCVVGIRIGMVVFRSAAIRYMGKIESFLRGKFEDPAFSFQGEAAWRALRPENGEHGPAVLPSSPFFRKIWGRRKAVEGKPLAALTPRKPVVSAPIAAPKTAFPESSVTPAPRPAPRGRLLSRAKVPSVFRPKQRFFKRMNNMMKIVEAGPRRKGFETFRLVRDKKKFLQHYTGSASRARTAVRRSRGKGQVRLVSTDASRPLGQRNLWETTYQDGTKELHRASPLVFDLNGGGVTTSRAVTDFDIDGDGIKDQVHDISSGEGLLVFDADGDGVSGENSLELLGDFTDLDGDGKKDGFENGFQALRRLAEKAVKEGTLAPNALEDGKLDQGELGALEADYGLKMKVGSLNQTAVPLLKAGIIVVFLSDAVPTLQENFDSLGNNTMTQEGAVFVRANGSAGSYEDVWLKKYAPRSSFGNS